MVHSVLIIGCGAIAGGYDADSSPDDWPLSHAGAIARDARFTLSACVDPDQAARGAFLERWRVPEGAGSLEAMEALPGQYDLVVIASPTPLHAEHLERALAMRPKAIFCEKPLAHSLGEARRLFEKAAARRVPLTINYTRRWQPGLCALVSSVRETSEWGRLLSAVGTYSKGVVHNGSHMVDLAMMFAGPLEVCAVGPALCDYWDDDPTVDAILTANNTGAAIHLVGGDCRAVTQFELVLSFERGEIAIRDGGLRIETRRVGASGVFAGYRQLSPPESAPGRYPEAMAAAYDNLAEVIAGKASPKWSNIHGITAQELCEEIRMKALKTLARDSAR
ncbi:MAG: Gfo/Idh/MocA family oxidoreductase [Pseudomonadota bacterium]